ncbi:hypothetical protein GCM10027423_15690 [Spirosoma arcticum]
MVREEQATEHLTATNAVEAGATAHYTAGQSITLQPGFLARAGSVFQATIRPVNSRRSPETGTTLTAKAFPNPFETTTTVEYSLPEAIRTTHTLTDAAGRPITRPDGRPVESAGLHQTALDLSQQPAGIYLYQLRTANGVKTLRLIKK